MNPPQNENWNAALAVNIIALLVAVLAKELPAPQPKEKDEVESLKDIPNDLLAAGINLLSVILVMMWTAFKVLWRKPNGVVVAEIVRNEPASSPGYDEPIRKSNQFTFRVGKDEKDKTTLKIGIDPPYDNYDGCWGTVTFEKIDRVTLDTLHSAEEAIAKHLALATRTDEEARRQKDAEHDEKQRLQEAERKRQHAEDLKNYPVFEDDRGTICSWKAMAGLTAGQAIAKHNSNVLGIYPWSHLSTDGRRLGPDYALRGGEVYKAHKADRADITTAEIRFGETVIRNANLVGMTQLAAFATYRKLLGIPIGPVGAFSEGKQSPPEYVIQAGDVITFDI